MLVSLDRTGQTGCLWVHSPVELMPALKANLDALGPVRHIVAPNFWHTRYARQWKDAYPEATLYGCPGLLAMEPDKRCRESVRLCCRLIRNI